MLYKRNTISRFCLTTRKLYSFTFTFCFVYKLKQEIISFDSLPLPLLRSAYIT
jgi:hypothetical protein